MNDRPSDDVAQARRAIALIDLTDLADDHAADGIGTLCDRAATHATAAVCVWPEFVATCAERLAGTGVRVATVVNFPSGDESAVDVVSAAAAALDAGADDVDLVLPYRPFLDGDVDRAAEMVDAVATLIERPRILKVILETGAFTHPEEIRAAADLVIAQGGDFLKTSTGKIEVGASIEAATAMLAAIAAADRPTDRPIGLKPSGGIRTFAQAIEYIDLADSVMGPGWATPSTFRFGATGLLDALLAVVAGEPDGSPSSATY